MNEAPSKRRNQALPLAISGLMTAAAALTLSSCATSGPPQRKVPLPGEGEISPLGWGSPQPGDPQPGLGPIPQTR